MDNPANKNFHNSTGQMPTLAYTGSSNTHMELITGREAYFYLLLFFWTSEIDLWIEKGQAYVPGWTPGKTKRH